MNGDQTAELMHVLSVASSRSYVHRYSNLSLSKLDYIFSYIVTIESMSDSLMDTLMRFNFTIFKLIQNPPHPQYCIYHAFAPIDLKTMLEQHPIN